MGHAINTTCGAVTAPGRRGSTPEPGRAENQASGDNKAKVSCRDKACWRPYCTNFKTEESYLALPRGFGAWTCSAEGGEHDRNRYRTSYLPRSCMSPGAAQSPDGVPTTWISRSVQHSAESCATCPHPSEWLDVINSVEKKSTAIVQLSRLART